LGENEFEMTEAQLDVWILGIKKPLHFCSGFFIEFLNNHSDAATMRFMSVM
jgi:hypothetical protein